MRTLPAELTSFVGRQPELAEVRRLLGQARLVTLTGVGGVGKTRLAMEAGRQLQRVFPDGIWPVELATLHDPDLLIHTISEVLGLADQTVRPQEDVLVEHLTGKRVLLILDNCEHLVDECRELAELLLKAVPQVKILVTSREALGAGGERLLVVDPLPIEDEAVALFADRATAVWPEFRLTEHNTERVAVLCRRVDGIPLAIELAAVQMRALSMEEIITLLDKRFSFLKRRSKAVMPRHQTLWTTIGWSHELCEPLERLLWAQLTVFAGDFDLTAAEMVCANDVITADQVFDLVAGLVGKSILQCHRTPQGMRYRMLDTVRAYGAEWLDRLDDEEVLGLRQRHLNHYLGLAEDLEESWFGPKQVEVAQRANAEQGNFRAALEFSLSTPGEEQTALWLAGSLWFYWVGCGHVGEGRHWLERVLAHDTTPTHARAKALWVDGYVAILQGDFEPAVRLLEECREQADATGDELAMAYAQHRLGCAALLQDQPELAELFFTDALERYARLGEQNSNTLMATVELAIAHIFLGDADKAFELIADARDDCESHGEQWAYAYTLYVMSYAEGVTGNLPSAIAFAKQSIRINRYFDDLLGIVLSLELLALFETTRGDARRGATLQGIAARIWPSVGPQLFGSAHFNAPHAECEAQARVTLGDSAYDEALAAGASLSLGQAVAYALDDTVPRPAPSSQKEGPLTRRELQIADLVADGLTNREIAAKLVIAQRTAESHVENILAKLGFSSRSQIAAWTSRQRES